MRMKMRWTVGCFRIIAALAPLISALQLFAQSNTRICVTRDELGALCGTPNVKLTFIDNGSLYLADFSKASPKIEEIPGIQSGAVAPVVSPDGKIIVYAVTNGNDEYGTASSSSGWLCPIDPVGAPVKFSDSAYVPRFVYDAGGNAKAIYSTCGKKNPQASYIWDGCGKVVERELSDGAPGPASVLWSGGSYFGGLSRDKRYLSTAEMSPCAFILDLRNSAKKPDTIHKFTVKKLSSGADTTVSIQVCNLSCSQSGAVPNAALYIDFSSDAFSAAKCALPQGLGEWGFHGRIFITRNDGKILRFFDVPQAGNTEQTGAGEIQESEWDYPEWSNHPYFAVATIMVDRLWHSDSWEHTYRNEFIYMINLRDSSYHKLIEITDSSRASTTDMRWPWLWIEIPSGFSEDSSWLNRNSAARFNGIRPHEPGRAFIKGKTVFCAGDIETLRLYGLQGKKMIVPTVIKSASHAATIDDKKLLLPPGVYYLQVISKKDGKRRVDVIPYMKW